MTDRGNNVGVEVDTDYLLRLRNVISKTKARKANIGGYSGYVTGHKRGRGSIFYDVRPWSEGDDIRHIDSYLTARTGVPHIRTSHEDKENKVILVADLRSSMFFGTRRALRSVVVAETISMTGWRAINASNQVGLVVISSNDITFIGWADNASKFAGLLHKLATLHREAKNVKSPVELCIDKVLEFAVKKSGSASIVIATALDAPGENFNKYAGLVTKRHDLVFLLISDKFEREPLPGYYPYYTQDGGSGAFRIPSRLAKKSLCDWPDRLTRLGARSVYIGSELDPSEVAQALDSFYDGSR